MGTIFTAYYCDVFFFDFLRPWPIIETGVAGIVSPRVSRLETFKLSIILKLPKNLNGE